jgi:hypothetical protein
MNRVSGYWRGTNDESLQRPASVKDGCSAIMSLIVDDDVIEQRDEEVEYGEPRLR